ncbi:ComEC/Rec2 family competence protein [Parapedobacter koreensis]|uniref:Competence protein ComEC n=1 Tax=Parapedobacter koreensis TaxID=332977 RepID=A0A1H7L0C8_9SPHI|nr:ComEC/Rec2 family competence protein [Parapedobacter koreensis]SEK92523.1 competence protein ComEC [Parapedobacter koreensis]
MNKQDHIHRGHIPFVRFLLALLVGIGASYAVAPLRPLYVAAWFMLMLLLIVFIGLVWLTQLRRHKSYGILGFLILSALAVVGLIQSWHSDPAIDRSHFSRYASRALIGYVADEPLMRGDHLRFPLVITQRYGSDGVTAVSGRLMLTVRIADSLSGPALGYGDELLIPAAYQEIPPPYNPGELDYQRYLANKNIRHQTYLQAESVEKIGKDKGNPLMAHALALRQQMVDKFSRYITDKDAFSVASTLILGYRADLSEALLQAFSNTGTIHVLSVSGMHVIIVFWVMSKLLWWMDRNKNLRIGKFILLFTAVWGYALLTGFSPSVSRAAIMITFVMAAATFKKQNRVYNSIAASAFFLLLYEPKFIADVGFQLSYLAVLGIVFLHPILQTVRPVANRLTKPIVDYAWMSVAAQSGAGPLAAYYFHQFPLYFLPANLLIVLPASGIMYLGFALLVLPPGQLASAVGVVLEKLILGVNGLLNNMEALPMASIHGIWMTWWQNLLIYSLILAAVFALSMRSKRWAYCALVCGAFLLVSSFSANVRALGQEEVVFFNTRREVAVGLISKGKGWIYSSLPSVDDQTIRYSVLPKLEAHVPTSAIRFIAQDSSYHDQRVYAKESIVQFGDLRFMVYTGKVHYTGHVHVDILLLRNNPQITWEKLMETVSCSKLILDGSNSDSVISHLKAAAENSGISVYVLKNNFAYVWDNKASS